MRKKTLIGIAVSVLFLYIALRGVSFPELAVALRRCNYLYLVPAFLVMYLLFVIRVLRWRYLVRPVKEVPFKNLFSATMIGFMANNILPARIGEFVRAKVLADDENIKVSSVFATIIVERLFDGLSLLFILLFMFLSVDLSAKLSLETAENLKSTGYGALGLYIVIICFIVFLNYKNEKAMRLVSAVLKPFPKKISDSVKKLLDSFYNGLKIEKGVKNISIIIIYSILHWIFCALPVYIILKGFGYDLPIEASFVVLIFKAFAVMIPAAPGYVGTLNVAVMYALSFYGIADSEGASISIVVWLVDFVPVVLGGSIIFLTKKLSITGIKQESLKEGKE